MEELAKKDTVAKEIVAKEFSSDGSGGSGTHDREYPCIACLHNSENVL